jgi:hypothetical protein
MVAFAEPERRSFQLKAHGTAEATPLRMVETPFGDSLQP